MLEKFLGKERLYFSDALDAKLEERARENLGADIEGLKAEVGAFLEGERHAYNN